MSTSVNPLSDILARMGRLRYQKPNVIRTSHGWKIRYRFYFLDGSSEERTRHFSSMGKREAEKARDEFLKAVNTPEVSMPSQVAFGIVLAKFLEQSESTVADTSYRNYRSTVKRHLAKRWGDTRMCDFDQVDVENWLAKLSLDYRAKTISNIKIVFGLAWKAAVRWGYTRLVNPVSLAPRRLGKPKEPREKRLTTDEQMRSILALLDDRARLMVQIMTFTGLRAGEALALTWADVAGEEITVNKIVVQHSNAVQQRVKTVNSLRVVPIAHILQMLQRPDSAEDSERIYPGCYNTLQNDLVHAARKIGCYYEGFGCHSFRRWFNTKFRLAGGSLELAMRQMGHASAQINDLYMLDSRLDERAEVVGRLVQKTRVM